MFQSKANQEWPNDKFTLGLFSYQLDGWADLIEGKGEKQGQVREQIFALLVERRMPDVEVEKKTAKESYDIFSDHRKYIVASTAPGASTAIYVGGHGQDLFVSWRTFIRPVLNSKLFVGIVSSAIGITFLFSVSRLLGIITSPYSRFGNPFVESSLSGFFVFTTFLIAEIVIVLFLGAQTKGYALAYFFVEPTYFDADDIAAMSFAAHYSILRALDMIGIDSSKLRLKQTFKTDRRGNSV